MALPASGPISGSQIWATELDGGATTNLSLSGMVASSSLRYRIPMMLIVSFMGINRELWCRGTEVLLQNLHSPVIKIMVMH
jgi:hypothetical protein